MVLPIDFTSRKIFSLSSSVLPSVMLVSANRIPSQRNAVFLLTLRNVLNKQEVTNNRTERHHGGV